MASAESHHVQDLVEEHHDEPDNRDDDHRRHDREDHVADRREDIRPDTIHDVRNGRPVHSDISRYRGDQEEKREYRSGNCNPGKR